MRWWAVAVVVLVAGCAQTSPPAPTTTTPPAATAPAAAPPPGFATAVESVPWQGPSVDAPTSYAGIGGWTMHQTLAPGNPFHLSNWPIAGAGAKSAQATRTVQDSIYLPDWTVDGKRGAVLLHDETPQPPMNAALLRPGDAGEIPLDWHDFRCEQGGSGCDVATRHLHLFPQAAGDGSASNLCSRGFETFPDGDAMPFPLAQGQTWSGDATGLFGLPMHQTVSVAGLARSPAWTGDAVHLVVAQQVIPGWVGCSLIPVWDDLSVTQFQIHLNATADVYYLPSAQHVVLRQARATYTVTAAAGGAPASTKTGNLTDEETWTPLAAPAVGAAYGDYEATLRALNHDSTLGPAGTHLRFDVTLHPASLRLFRGDADPMLSATAVAADWPSPKLPSGVTWHWAMQDGWNPSQISDGNATFTPHLEGPGTYAIYASLGGYSPGASGAVGIADRGAFDLTCGPPDTTTAVGPRPCGSGGGFHWYGPMGRLKVWANITSDTTLASQFYLGHLVVTTPPNAEGYNYGRWTCDTDDHGRCFLDLAIHAPLYVQNPPGNWTMAWSSDQPEGVNQTVHIDWQAEPSLPTQQ